MMPKVFAFFRINRVKFSKSSADPLFIRITKRGHSKFSKDTIYQILDSKNVAVFNTEFCIPFSLHPQGKKKAHKKIVYARVGKKKVKDKNAKNFLGKWKFDLCGFDMPESLDERSSKCKLKDDGTAILYFNVTIVTRKDYPNGMPLNFFDGNPSNNRSGRPQKTFQGIDVDILDTVTETEIGNETPISVVKMEKKRTTSSKIPPAMTEPKKTENKKAAMIIQTPEILPKKEMDSPDHSSSQKAPLSSPVIISHQQDNAQLIELKELREKRNLKMSFNSSESESHSNVKIKKSFYGFDGIEETTPEELARLQLRKIYLHTLEEHETTLDFIAFKQCLIKFTLAVFKTISHPMYRNGDLSEELILPIRDYRIFEIKNLTQEQFEKLLASVHTAIQNTLAEEHSISDLFSIFSTILHFGLKIAYEGILFTTVYKNTLAIFENYLNKIIVLLVQSLVAVLASSIDLSRLEAADRDTILNVQNELFLLWQSMKQMNIPPSIIQQIQVSCCRSIDILLYNSAVDSREMLTSELISAISNKIRLIQEMFQCPSDQVMDAFEQILMFIRTAEGFLGGIEISKIGKASMLNRAIAERCHPPVQLPANFTMDKLGPVCYDTSKLRLSNDTEIFKFCYDWVISVDPSLFKG